MLALAEILCARPNNQNVPGKRKERNFPNPEIAFANIELVDEISPSSTPPCRVMPANVDVMVFWALLAPRAVPSG